MEFDRFSARQLPETSFRHHGIRRWRPVWFSPAMARGGR
jgi:hypothetical protein